MAAHVVLNPNLPTRPVSPPTRLPFKVRTLGRMRLTPYHSTPGTWHDDAMLTVVLSGRGVYQLAGRTHTVETGQVGLVLPGGANSGGTNSGGGGGGDVGVLMADPAQPYDHLYCRFAGGLALTLARRIRQRLCPGWPFFTDPRCATLAEVLMRGLALEKLQLGVRETSPERPRRVDAVLAEALALLLEPPLSRATPEGPRVTRERLRLYLLEHLATPTNLDQVAAHFHVSKAHLCRVARRLLGQTLQAAWEQIKLQRATLLLRETDLSVGEVARRVGYTDPLYFSKVFRRSLGASPRQWRGR